jgi:hypothetical protein
MSETDGSATPRKIDEDPDEAFALWHFLEFGYRPPRSESQLGRYASRDTLRSAWEHGRKFERELTALRNSAAIRDALKEIGHEGTDTGRAD